MQKKGTVSAGIFDFSKRFDKEKLQALHTFMEKKQMSLEQVLMEYLESLYQKHVPRDVRFYLEMGGRVGVQMSRGETKAVNNLVSEEEKAEENPPS